MKKLTMLLVCLLMSGSLISMADEEVSIFSVPQATQAPAEQATQIEPAGQEEVTPNPATYTQADGSVLITISAAGDTTFVGNGDGARASLFDRELQKQDGDLAFVTNNVREILQEDDLTIVNFETNLTNAPVYKKNNEFVFSAPREYVEVLTHGSIEAVAYENNHMMDYGQTGVDDTRQALTEAGIVWSSEDQPGRTVVNGVRVTMLAYQTFNGNYPRLFDKVPQDIAKARMDSDIIIVSFHWGAEKDYAPNSNQQKLGRLTIDAGADLVLGHHSHRINPIEYYNGRYIVYSLANFSFSGNSKPSDMSSFIFQVRFAVKDGMAQSQAFRIVPMRISSKTDYNDFVPTPFTDQRLVDNVINVLKSNGRNLKYAVEHYPVDWE